MNHEATSEARARLDQAARTPLVRPRDRWIHAVGTAAMGPVFGLYAAFGSSALAAVVFFVVVGAVAWWRGRTATVPRHARSLSNGAAVASLALFGLAVAVLDSDHGSAWLRVAVVVVVSAPAAVAGVLIARGPR